VVINRKGLQKKKRKKLRESRRKLGFWRKGDIERKLGRDSTVEFTVAAKH
jgi:hypothetical protein